MSLSYLSILVLAGANIDDDLFVVTCPAGWLPIGDLCFALSEIAPHTECRGDKALLKAGLHNPLFSIEPGICAERNTSAPLIKCAEGGTLVLERNDEGEEQFKCEFIAFEDAFENPYHRHELLCEDGFELYDHATRVCKAALKTDPIVYQCPYKGKLIFDVYNEYAFLEQRGILCEYFEYQKGRAWCPHGFRVWGEPFPTYEFGDPLPHGIGKDLKSPVEGRPQIDRKVFPLGGFQPRSLVDASCIQILAVPHHECDEYDCNTEYVQSVRKTVRKLVTL